MIWWSVYWKPHTDILFIELIEAKIEKWFKEGRNWRHWHAKEPSIWCQNSGDRSPISRAFRRPVDNSGDRSTKLDFRLLATNSSSLKVPPMTKFSWSNLDFSIDQDASYASAASLAKSSFCKGCSLGKLGLRPSYAKDTTIFHSYYVSKEDICGSIHPYCGHF